MTRTDLEGETYDKLLDLIERDEFDDVPGLVLAGALMRVSVGLAVNVVGPHRAPDACQTALDCVLRDTLDGVEIQ